MARVKLNPILEGMRGQVGDLVFKRYGDGVIISRKALCEEAAQDKPYLTLRENTERPATVTEGTNALVEPGGGEDEVLFP